MLIPAPLVVSERSFENRDVVTAPLQCDRRRETRDARTDYDELLRRHSSKVAGYAFEADPPETLG